jgi:uncharacterized protein YqgC (DUF456 family)
MDWVYYSILLLMLVGGLVLNVVTLPGNWLVLLSAVLYGWATRWEFLAWGWLISLLVLAIVGELLELLAAGSAATKAGGSRLGAVGALVGALVGGIFLTGMIPIPILGTLVGILAGTFLGSAFVEVIIGKDVTQSLVIGGHAAKGRLYGTVLKVTIGVVMSVLLAFAAMPFHWW